MQQWMQVDRQAIKALVHYHYYPIIIIIVIIIAIKPHIFTYYVSITQQYKLCACNLTYITITCVVLHIVI